LTKTELIKAIKNFPDDAIIKAWDLNEYMNEFKITTVKYIDGSIDNSKKKNIIMLSNDD
jgi:hypothetical protein